MHVAPLPPSPHDTIRVVPLPPDPAPRRSRGRLAVMLSLAAVAMGAAGVATVQKPWVPYLRDAGVSDALAAQLADSTALVVPSSLSATDLSAAEAGDAVMVEQHTALVAFYDARQGAPAWTDARARHAALTLLARANRDGLPDALAPDLVRLAEASGDGAPDSLRARLDARLTAAVLRFGASLSHPRADALALYGANAWEPTTHAPRDAVANARSLATSLSTADDPAAALDAFVQARRPQHAGYRTLQAALAREMDLAANPGLVVTADSGAAAKTLRDRLAIEDAAAPLDSPQDLASALRAYQTRQGLPASGRLDPATKAALNRRQADAIPALALNLERWRWLPDSLGPLHVFVNIPEYRLALVEESGGVPREVFASGVVVGLPSWATPVFSDTMETVVFNPTWTMPASIQRQSYGRLRPDRAVRQPGPGNALGRVKFLFPNRHAVYIHDTPSKWAFTVERRALSHGCVRIGDPHDFAVAVLSRTNGWPASRVDAIFSGPWTLQDVTLDRTIPVHIAYFTAVADAAGRVTTFPDVYNRDPRLAEALGLAPAAPTVAMTPSWRRDAGSAPLNG